MAVVVVDAVVMVDATDGGRGDTNASRLSCFENEPDLLCSPAAAVVDDDMSLHVVVDVPIICVFILKSCNNVDVYCIGAILATLSPSEPLSTAR